MGPPNGGVAASAAHEDTTDDESEEEEQEPAAQQHHQQQEEEKEQHVAPKRIVGVGNPDIISELQKRNNGTSQAQDIQNTQQAAAAAAPPSETGNGTFIVEFEKGTQKLGISIAGGRDECVEPGNPKIYVSDVIEGGVIAETGKIQVGDAILRGVYIYVFARICVCVCAFV